MCCEVSSSIINMQILLTIDQQTLTRSAALVLVFTGALSKLFDWFSGRRSSACDVWGLCVSCVLILTTIKKNLKAAQIKITMS